jgi:hypothetical protein
VPGRQWLGRSPIRRAALGPQQYRQLLGRLNHLGRVGGRGPPARALGCRCRCPLDLLRRELPSGPLRVTLRRRLPRQRNSGRVPPRALGRGRLSSLSPRGVRNS